MSKDELFLQRVSTELRTELAQLDLIMKDVLEKTFQRTWKRFSREIKEFCAFLEGRAAKR